MAVALLISSYFGLPAAQAAVTSTDTTNPSYVMGNFGIGTNAPTVSLDVVGGLRAGSSANVTACSGPTEGAQRYNYSSHAMEYCNGTSWLQSPSLIPGSTTNLVASGPASTLVYSVPPANVSCNFVPTFGACTNLAANYWPGNGTATQNNANCVHIENSTYQIVLDLGSVKTINKIYLTMENSNGFTIGQVSFSSDNVTFTSTATFTNPNNVASTIYQTSTLSPNVTARYLRFMNGINAQSSAFGTVCSLAVGP